MTLRAAEVAVELRFSLVDPALRGGRTISPYLPIELAAVMLATDVGALARQHSDFALMKDFFGSYFGEVLVAPAYYRQVDSYFA